ncbi:MAG: hypothetical protein JEY79_03230 [Pseudodesulfovibrio sp.]|nr:hypothetical protein [Pseudodesulfovibrio sp.]
MITSSDSDTHSNREISARVRHLSVADIEKKWNLKFGFNVAAPSFVIPAGAAENSRFLSKYFPEICLLFFETDSCLEYTESDLPHDLSDLPVKWHVHLPLDLPWKQGLDVVWAKLAGLMDKAAHVSPHLYVLHPPTVPDMLVPLAERLREAEIDPVDFLLENVEESDLPSMWEDARTGGYSTCLDLGHILAYGQHSVLDLPGLWDTVRMLHVYAPDARDNSGRHMSLANLDKNGQKLLRTMLDHFRGDTVTMEVFNEKDLFKSLDLLAKWMSGWRNDT